ncbi:MAG: hypothetical protein WAM14_06525 [Candidatus Nitrosopolaris sp.]
MLTLLGFNSINLGTVNTEDETRMQEPATLHAIDIISYYPNKRIFLACDCTINVPASDKIDKIRNASDFISLQVGIFAEIEISAPF